MIKPVLAIGLSFTFILTPPAFPQGMQNEPKDFMGIAWGAPLDGQKDVLTAIGQGGEVAYYRRASDKLTLGGVDARRITYHFFKGQFAGGTILTVGSSNKQAVVSYLTEKYGPPERLGQHHPVYSWTGERVGILFSCDISSSCYCEFFDKELKKLEEATQGGSETPAKDDD
jgi:hypothetical protein